MTSLHDEIASDLPEAVEQLGQAMARLLQLSSSMIQDPYIQKLMGNEQQQFTQKTAELVERLQKLQS